jgi:hypothetical protein
VRRGGGWPPVNSASAEWVADVTLKQFGKLQSRLGHNAEKNEG